MGSGLDAVDRLLHSSAPNHFLTLTMCDAIRHLADLAAERIRTRCTPYE